MPLNKLLCLVSFSAAFICADAVAEPLLISVSPSGKFYNDCKNSPKDPIALESAISWINCAQGSQFSKPSTIEGVVLSLVEGVYRIKAPLILAARKNEQAFSKIVIKGPVNGAARISGATSVLSTRFVSAASFGLDLAAGLSLVEIDFPSSVADTDFVLNRGFGRQILAAPPELYYNGAPLQISRWPKAGYLRMDNVEGGQFSTDPSISEKFVHESNLLGRGYWFYDWADETLPVLARPNKLGIAFGFKQLSPKYGIKKNQRFFFENVLFSMNAVGDWYASYDKRKFYLVVNSAFDLSKVEASVAGSLIIAEGVRDVVFQDLSFDGARGDAIKISKSNDVIFDRVSVKNSSGRGFTISGENVGIKNSLIYDVGEGGVWLGGGDRSTLKKGLLFVSSSIITRFNRRADTYRAGVEVNGVGNTVDENVIYDAPHNAILFFGNDHVIRKNEIFNVANNSSDAGAIYTGRDWTARGSIIEGNYFHDIKSNVPGEKIKGVYLDDQASGIVVKNNVFARVDEPTYIGGGRNNVINGNIYIDSSPAFHIDSRGTNWQRDLTNNEDWTIRKLLREVPYQSQVFNEKYPGLKNILSDEPGKAKYNSAENNFLIGSILLEVVGDSASALTLSGNRDENSACSTRTFDVLGDKACLSELNRLGIPGSLPKVRSIAGQNSEK